MKSILLIFIFISQIFAISPYNLEGLQAVNLKISDKSKLLSKEAKNSIQKKLENELNQLSIKTSTDEFSNLIVKIESIKIDKKYAINISLYVVENINPSRNNKLQGLGITYTSNYMFESKGTLQEEIENAIFKLLFDEFKKQYQEEN